MALPLKGTPAVAFGRVTGPYAYVPDGTSSMRQQRVVTWIREVVPRGSIDQDIVYSLGAFLTAVGFSAPTPKLRQGTTQRVAPN